MGLNDTIYSESTYITITLKMLMSNEFPIVNLPVARALSQSSHQCKARGASESGIHFRPIENRLIEIVRRRFCKDPSVEVPVWSVSVSPSIGTQGTNAFCGRGCKLSLAILITALCAGEEYPHHLAGTMPRFFKKWTVQLLGKQSERKGKRLGENTVH